MTKLYKITIFIFTILLWSFSGCKTQISCTSATSQIWYGGAAGSGGGINYEIELENGSGKEFEVLSITGIDETLELKFGVYANQVAVSKNLVQKGTKKVRIVVKQNNPAGTRPSARIGFKIKIKHSSGKDETLLVKEVKPKKSTFNP